MITYFLEFSLLLFFFGFMYYIFLERKQEHKLKRAFILFSFVTSLTIPLLPKLFASQVFKVGTLLPEVTFWGQSNQVITETSMDGSFQIPVLLILYCLVSLFFFIRLVLGFIKLSSIKANGIQKFQEGKQLIYSEEIESPCSFFDYIFLPLGTIFSKDELSTILKHENLHHELGHTKEKMLFNVSKIFLWWHPILWYLESQLVLVHEYEVDAHFNKKEEFSKYKEILVQLSLLPRVSELVNPLSSNINKRLKVMNQTKKKSSRFQFFTLALFILGGTFLIHSCSDDVANDANKQDAPTTLKAQSGESSYQITSIDTFITFDYDTKEETIKIAESETTVYIEADKMPLFPGCDQGLPYEELRECSNKKLLQYIYTNIKYPEAARTAEIEGMVLVKFIVSEYGFPHSIEIIKNPGGGLDQEVSRMLTKMSNDIEWIPGEKDGKKVSVEFTLPVKFKLQDDSDK